MPRARKQLNLPLIKSLIMFVMGLWVGMLGGICGIGMQVAAGPMMAFLLGFNEDKQKGTGIAFGLFSSAAAAIGAGYAGLHVETGQAVVLAIGAFVGVLATAKSASQPEFGIVRRIGHTLVMPLGIYLISVGYQSSKGVPIQALNLEAMRSSLGYGVIGFAAGALSSYMQMAMGILVVPALIFIAALAAPKAIVTSLVVIAVASLLPALSRVAAGHVDRGAGFWMMVGGALGGYAGGAVLARQLQVSPIPLVAYGLVVMFLSAYTLYRNTGNPGPPATDETS